MEYLGIINGRHVWEGAGLRFSADASHPLVVMLPFESLAAATMQTVNDMLRSGMSLSEMNAGSTWALLERTDDTAWPEVQA